MNRKRLQLLRKKLLHVAQNPGNLTFNMLTWGQKKEQGQERARPVSVEQLKRALTGQNECGTACCALGLATTIPSFQRDGLQLIVVEPYFASVIQFAGKSGYRAGAAFFGITYSQARYLFDPVEYPIGYPSIGCRPISAKDVAERIEALLGGAT